jgi:hypothetical protein
MKHSGALVPHLVVNGLVIWKETQRLSLLHANVPMLYQETGYALLIFSHIHFPTQLYDVALH